MYFTFSNIISTWAKYYIKVNASSYGDTIEDLFEIDIDYYVRVNFTTLINLVDAIGGIDVYSDKSFVPLNYKHL